MAKAGELREQVVAHLQSALRELHQASMYAQGVAHTDVGRIVKTVEQLKERLSTELSDDLREQREESKRKTALMKSRQEAALANRLKARKKTSGS